MTWILILLFTTCSQPYGTMCMSTSVRVDEYATKIACDAGGQSARDGFTAGDEAAVAWTCVQKGAAHG